MDRALEAHLDPAAASCVEQMEGDTLRTGGGEELDGNDGEAEGDVEILQRARHGFRVARGSRVGCGIHYSAA